MHIITNSHTVDLIFSDSYRKIVQRLNLQEIQRKSEKEKN